MSASVPSTSRTGSPTSHPPTKWTDNYSPAETPTQHPFFVPPSQRSRQPSASPSVADSIPFPPSSPPGRSINRPPSPFSRPLHAPTYGSPPRRPNMLPSPVSTPNLATYGAASRARAASIAALHEPPVLIPRSASMTGFGAAATTPPPLSASSSRGNGLNVLSEGSGREKDESGSEYSGGEEEAPWRGVDLAEPDEPETRSPLLSHTFSNAFRLDAPDTEPAVRPVNGGPLTSTVTSTESVPLTSNDGPPRSPSRGQNHDPSPTRVADHSRHGSSLSMRVSQVDLSFDHTDGVEVPPRAMSPSLYQPRRSEPSPVRTNSGSSDKQVPNPSQPMPISRKSSQRSAVSVSGRAASPANSVSSSPHKSLHAQDSLLSAPPRRPPSRASTLSNQSKDDESSYRSLSTSPSQARPRSPSPRPPTSSAIKPELLLPLLAGGTGSAVAEQQRRERLAATAGLRGASRSPSPARSMSPLPTVPPSVNSLPRTPASPIQGSEARKRDLPAVPAKSQRRSSTLRKNGFSPSEAAAVLAPAPGPSSSPSLVPLGLEEQDLRSPAFSETSEVSTPLSASDFADAYGQDWRNSVHAYSEASRSSHFREPATDSEPVPALEPALDPRRLETPSPTAAEYFEASSVSGSAHSIGPELPAALGHLAIADSASESGSVSRRASEATVGPARGEDLEQARTDGLGSNGELPPIPHEPATPRGPAVNGGQAQLDAKARAVAFVADLKRAREEREAAAAAEARHQRQPNTELHSPVVRAPVPTRHQRHDPASPPEDTPTQTPTRATTPTPSAARRMPSSSSGLSALLAPTPPPVDLSRRRPLPPSLQIAADLRQCRSPGDRALVYARKINALAREDSGLAAWLGLVKGARGGASEVRSPRSPRPSGTSRREGSFPIRAGDPVYRATEIPPGPAHPAFQPVSVPYPGALHHSASSASHKPPSAIKPGFFSGLGRKASAKSHAGRTPPLLGSAGHTGSFPSIGSPLGASVSATPTISRPIGGPRPPRGSFDIVPPASSVEGSPLLGESPSLPAVPGAQGGSVLAGGAGMQSKLSAMRDMLPGDADPDQLADALVQAGGDEVSAISIYLAKQAA